MIKIENDCVGCPPEMGCLGSSCPYRDVPHYYCDDCGYEDDTFYHFNDGWNEDTEEIYCYDCALNRITTKMINDYFEEDDFYTSVDVKYFYYIILANRFNLSDEEENQILNNINEEEYKAKREEYLKTGDVKMALDYLKDISLLDDIMEFIFEVDKI